MTLRTDRILPKAIVLAAGLLSLLATAFAGSASAALPWDRDFVCGIIWCLSIDSGDGDDTIFVDEGSAIGLTPGNGHGNGQGGGRPVDVLRIAIIDAGNGQDFVVNRGTVSGIGEASASHKVPARAEAFVAGIDAGEDADIVRNEGVIRVGGSAEAQTTSAVLPPWAHGEAGATAVGIEGGEGSDAIANSGMIAASAESTVRAEAAGSPEDARAEAIGVSGGAGGDRIENSGTVAASSIATTGAAGGANPSGKTVVDHNPPPGLVAGNTAEAVATAVYGSSGDDEIVHSGAIAAGAEARAGDVAFTVKLHDASPADMTASARANGTGIAAGSGDDRVSGSGSIAAAATADAGSVAISGMLEKNVSLDVGADGAAAATGTDGGDGNDVLTLSGATTAVAASSVHDVSLELDYVGKPGNRYGNDRNADNGRDEVKPLVAGAVSSSASAAGIDGGAGDDAVTNAGSIDATATASVTTHSVSLEADDLLATDVSIHVTGAATGMAGGDGNDNIVNGASIMATGNADATGVSLSVALNGGGAADARLSVQAVATGIAGGAGDDAIANTGTITASSSVGTPGAVLDVTASDNAAVAAGIAADAISVGIDGGDGNDGIVNSASITATADSNVERGSASVSFPGSASLDAATVVRSNAFGIEGGAGGDTISNEGTILAQATSQVAGAIAGDAEGDASLNTAANGDAIATGISGGTDNDAIVNSGGITANATGTSGLDEVTAEFIGRAAGGGGTDAASRATGIDGGSGDDTVRNRGAIASTATSTATSRWISAILLGGGTADSSADATALASGIAGESGNDSIGNDNVITAGAAASASSLNATFTAIGGAVSATDNASTIATASSTGIDGGEGGDRIANRASLSATATATAEAAGTAVTLAVMSIADASATSKATAVGIEGGTGDDSVENAAGIAASAVAATDVWNIVLTGAGLALTTDFFDLKTPSRAAASAAGISGGGGSDNVVNLGPVTVTSSATVTQQDIAVALLGGGLAASGASADATGTGIHGGAGNDNVSNSGAIAVTSTSDLTAVGVGFGAEGIAVSTDRRSDAGTSSEATAAGIDGGAGDDIVANGGNVSATATADALTIRGSVVLSDLAGAVVTDASSKASAGATGITGGEGDDRDTIVNEGSVTATATADAKAFSGSFAYKGFGVPLDFLPLNPWETARDLAAMATATGIAGGGGNDNIVNRGTIVATADADALWVDVAVRVEGSTSVDAPTATTARATGISGGAGDDEFLNLSAITATAEADTVSGGLSLAFTPGKFLPTKASANAAASADTMAVGIEGGDGANRIESGGTISATANSDAIAASVAAELATGSGVGALGGFPMADSSATATARTRGVTGGDNTDTITTRGTIAADADSLAVPTSVSVAKRGIGLTFVPYNLSAASKAISAAAGIDAGGGNDAVANDAQVTATASAEVVSDAISVVLEGVAAAYAGVETTAQATGIAGGAGNDNIVNRGALSTSADSTFWVLNVAVTKYGASGVANPFWDGGGKAQAHSYGIDAGEGDDAVWNSARIIATATDNTVSNGVSATLEGLAATIMTSTLRGEAVGIAAGGGKDTVYNQGDVTAVARTEAWSLNVGVAKTGIAAAADAFWDGGTKAETYAAGIDSGAGDDRIENRGFLRTISTDNTYSVGGTGTWQGFGLSILTTTATAGAAGIAGGEGADTIANYGGPIETTAAADADTVSVSLNYQGAAVTADAVWDAGTKAEARAFGLDGAAGIDNIVNTGSITARSDAETDSWGVSGSFQGAAVGIMTSTATTQTAGIAGGLGDDVIVNGGAITSSAHSNADTTSISVTYQGVSVSADAVWDGGTTSDAAAYGIDGGAGNDNVVNMATLTVTSTGESQSNGISASIQGVAGAIVTSAAHAEAAGISGGDGTDAIRNGGAVTSTADATANGVQVALSGQGVALAADAVWDGGTTAEARSAGIDGGGGGGSIWNNGTIAAIATANTTVVGVSAAAEGVGATIVTSTADAAGAGIMGGGGAEKIDNLGAVSATVTADADTISISAAGAGVAAAADAVWDGGTKAIARGTGIDAGAGIDNVSNSGSLTVASTADSDVTGVSATLAGVGVTIVSASADAGGAGIAGGEGDDAVRNEGNIGVTATANADTVSVSFSGTGVAAAADSVWDTGTKAFARAAGIDAGGGSDGILNLDNVAVTANAHAGSNSVSVAVLGAAAALARSTAQSSAAGIAGGEGADAITNRGDLTVTGKAEDLSVTVSATVEGVAASANAVWDGGTLADTLAAGIDAGGGNDNVANFARIEVRATDNAYASGGTVALMGVGGTVTTATALAGATGISGGGGEDAIGNAGEIVLDAAANAERFNVTASLLGAAVEADSSWDSGTTADARAAGIDGGAGSDVILNQSGIGATATATSKSSGISAVLLGAGATVVSSTATARAAGIEGGEGGDVVWNEAALTSSATSTAGIFSLSVAPVGMAAAVDAIWSSGPHAEAIAVGIDGGAGNDNVANLAAIDGDAQSTANATAVSVTLAGAGFTDATLTAKAGSTGLDGGEGNDVLSNYGTIDLLAKAQTDGSSTAVTLAGYGDAKLGTTSEATAVGIDGGAGNDNVVNGTGKAIGVLANADADSGAVSVGLAGDSPVGGGPKATAAAVGIDAGAGDDAVVNYGSIDADARATADAGAVTVQLIGYAPTDVAPVAIARATGIGGGDGDDVIVNASPGTISASAADNTAAGSNPVNIMGQADTDASLSATAAAMGIDGGAGADSIGNAGRIEVSATSKSTAPGASVNIFGLADAQSNTIADSTAVGIAGGAGNDNIVNAATGVIDAAAAAGASSDGGPVNIFGEAEGDATLGGTARAVGIDAGTGDDTVLNAGAIAVVAVAKADASGTSTAIFGDANGTAGASATATAVGIDGGAGNDTIVNSGSIRVAGGPLEFSTSASGISPYGILPSSIDNAGISWAVTSNASWNLFGEATSGATLSAAGESTGIRGGDGSDAIRNDNTVEAEAWSNAAASGNAKSFIGDAQKNADTRADSAAAGIEGNGGDDTIVNGGRIVARAHAGAAATGYADLFIGGPTASASARAVATASGIDAGDGNNVVENDGTIEAEAEAAVYTNALADSDLGKNWATAITKTGATAYGIRSGDGDDRIVNRGAVTANATAVESANTTADEDASAKAGNVDYAPLLASAAGILAGEGVNTVTNDNAISAESSATANARTISKSHFDTSYGTAKAGAIANADGIRAGSGPDNVVNNGSIAATARANGDATSDYPAGQPHLDVTKSVIGGGDNTFFGAVASGIRAGDGSGTITNRGTITALAQITESALAWANTDTTVNHADAWAGADGQAAGIRVGNGNSTIRNFGVIDARATTTATLIKARADEYGTSLIGKDGSFRAAAAGIRAGDGNNVVVNDNVVTVSATASANGEAIGASHSDTAYATAKGGAASDAVGIVAGGGANRIINSGSLSVSSSAAATVHADYPGGERHLDYATADAGGTGYPVVATAAGIRAGHGASSIANLGSITVDAAGSATATAYSGTYGADTAASAFASSAAVAAGIEAGDGGNVVENRGTITVHAGSDASAGAYSSSTWGDENPYATRSRSATAYGILTGSGSDTILNFGTIHAENRIGATSTAAIGISSGAANDGVFLMEGSRVEGLVDLGTGDDRLTVAGNAVLTGLATGNAGSDLLVLQGNGGLAVAPVLFEALAKEGAGIFTLPSLSTLRRIETIEGTLRIGGDYRLAPDGTIMSHVYPDGRNGKLQVGGTAVLGGTLEVVRKGGAYVDGTTYSLVTAGAISGGFGTVILPAASPLLSFAWERSTDNVSVAVSAKSFASAAGGRSEIAVARGLDALVPVAEGEMAEALGGIQRLPSTSEIRKAFLSLSPESHGYIARSAVDSARLHTGSLKVRMAAVRDGAGASRGAEGDAPVRLAYAGPRVGPLVADGQRKREDLRNGAWLIGFSQSGDQEVDSGFNGFDYTISGLATGYDRALGDRFVAGGSFGYALSSVHVGGNGGDGNVKSNNFSLYATWFTRRVHLDAALSYGVERFENNRNIDIGGIVSTAHSTHDGETFTASLGGGSVFPVGPWRFEPVASLDYVRLSEKGFQETGAGPLSLAVPARTTDALVSEVGVRVARTYSLWGGDAIPELGVTWKHDFGIDDEVVAASFAGAPGSVFSVEGQPIARDGIAPHAGITFAREGGLKTSLYYVGDFRRKYESNAVIGELRYEF